MHEHGGVFFGVTLLNDWLGETKTDPVAFVMKG